MTGRATARADAGCTSGAASRLREREAQVYARLPSIHRRIDDGISHRHAKVVNVAIHAPFIAPENRPSPPFECTLHVMPMPIHSANQHPTTKKTRPITAKSPSRLNALAGVGFPSWARRASIAATYGIE